MLAGNTGALFAPDGRSIGFSDERLLLAATTIRELFGKKASTPVTLQFGYNELQDGLRAGTVGSATFGLYRYKGLERQVTNNDLDGRQHRHWSRAASTRFTVSNSTSMPIRHARTPLGNSSNI
jgi:hypothetical protein